MIATAGILGIVEGLTEFLPVSSTGHLILAGHLLHFQGELASTFEIFIQLGAILSIVVLYWEKFKGLFNFKSSGEFAGVQGLSLLGATTAPALILGLGLHHFIKEHLFNPTSVALALTVGGIWILAIEKIRPEAQKIGLESLQITDAVKIGLFQCLAMWPGFSRAGATILGAMMIGVDRKTATEYSFFAAVPVMLAATALDLLKSLHSLHGSDVPFFGLGFVIAFVTALITVKLFVNFVSRHTLKVFGWYRLVVAAAVFIFWK